MKVNLYSDIEKAFVTLSQYDEGLSAFWANEIYGLDGDLIDEKVNEDILRQLENDVMRVMTENENA